MFKVVFGIIIGILAVVFALQNVEDVVVRFLFWELPPLPRALVLIVMLAAGFLIGVAVGGWTRRRRRK